MIPNKDKKAEASFDLLMLMGADDFASDILLFCIC